MSLQVFIHKGFEYFYKGMYLNTYLIRTSQTKTLTCISQIGKVLSSFQVFVNHIVIFMVLNDGVGGSVRPHAELWWGSRASII